MKICQMKGIPLINIVRRDEQVKLLKDEFGCQYILNQTSETFEEDLRSLAKELKATVLLECVGGSFSAKVLECMPSRSTCVLYGSFREVGLEGFDPLLLIGRSYKVEGFVLGLFIKSKGLCGVLPLMNKAISLMNDTTLHSNI